MGFIGCGRVARTLAPALARAGYDVAAAWSRKPEDAARLVAAVPGAQACASGRQVVDTCDFVWLTVADDAIAPVAEGLAWSARHKVVHCSGATGLSALQAVGAAGGLAGGFHPLQMFANPEVALDGLPGCTIGIEAPDAFGAELAGIARRLGCVPFHAPAGARALYHASAYYVGPFFIALLDEACAFWKSFGATERQALDALLPLLAGTVSAVKDAGLAGGMGGCVARGDAGTVARHLDAVDGFGEAAGRLYRDLALRTVPLGMARGTLDGPRAEKIGALLRAAPAGRAASRKVFI